MFGRRRTPLERILDKYITDIANNAQKCQSELVRIVLQRSAENDADTDSVLRILNTRSPSITLFACIVVTSLFTSKQFLLDEEVEFLYKEVLSELQKQSQRRPAEMLLTFVDIGTAIILIYEEVKSSKHLLKEVKQKYGSARDERYLILPILFGHYYQIRDDEKLMRGILTEDLVQDAMALFQENGGNWLLERQTEIKKLLSSVDSH